VTLLRHRSQNHPQQTALRGALTDIDDRRTPPDLLAECAALADVVIFDLDVAASATNTKARAFYNMETDGLRQPWWGTVWCNPPYSDCAAWVDKAHREAHRCDVIVMLLPANRTEQRWWQDLVEQWRIYGPLEVFFLAGRRRFDRPGWVKPAKGDRPPFGLCVLVWHGDRQWTAHTDDELEAELEATP
jgi:phage N-6-adenine-methyltransferase